MKIEISMVQALQVIEFETYSMEVSVAGVTIEVQCALDNGLTWNAKQGEKWNDEIQEPETVEELIEMADTFYLINLDNGSY